jgi:AraC family transcriptional regulator
MLPARRAEGKTDRARLRGTTIGLVEHFRCRSAPGDQALDGFSPRFQVCFPYRGLFVWGVGGEEVVGDANQVLFVTAGEDFRLRSSSREGYAELIVTPDPAILADLLRSDSPLDRHPMFQRRRRRSDPHLQRRLARFLHRSLHDELDDAAADEEALALVREALDGETAGAEPASPTRRLIRRTKEYLEANLSSPLRLRDVAREVGASPAYLTDVFRRIEGVPLHAYLTQLRLAEALVELPHADDLTALAFNLGFSSHSHFASAFRRAFGCTPSRFRDSTRPRGRRDAPVELTA